MLMLPSLWAAFKDVITSFTSGIVSPVIGLIFKAGFKNLKYILEKGNFNELKKKDAEGWLQAQLTMHFYTKLEIC